MRKVLIGGKPVPYTVGLKKVTELMAEHFEACRESNKNLRVLVSTKKAVASYAVLRKHRIVDLAAYFGINYSTLYYWIRDYLDGNYNNPANTCCIQRR